MTAQIHDNPHYGSGRIDRSPFIMRLTVYK